MRQVALGVLAGALLAAPATAVAAPSPVLDRVSVGPGGAQADGFSAAPRIARDGTVAFLSAATNLAPGDTTGTDLSVFARRRGTTRLAGSPIGVPPLEGRDDDLNDLSDDGRLVAFTSWVALLPGDTNALPDVYVRDLRTGALRRVSLSSSGEGGDGWSAQAAISGDGRWVAFASTSSNLVPAANPDGSFDIFLRDLRRGVTTHVAGGAWTPDVDRRGRTVAYVRLGGTDPVGVTDVRTGRTEVVSVDTEGRPADRASFSPVISGDGTLVAFATDATLDPGDVVRPPPGPPSGSGGAMNVYLRDRRAGTTEQVDVSGTGAHADATSEGPSMSASGRYVAFTSTARNLVPGDTNEAGDAFVRDRRRGTTERVSLGTGGRQADGQTHSVDLDPRGRAVAFSSFASNLVPGDTNGTGDVFVRRLRP